MKKIISLLCLCGTLFTSQFMSASLGMHVEASKNSTKLISVLLSTVEIGETLKIKNDKGEVVFSDTISEKGHYKKVISLKKLTCGEYRIENISSHSINILPIIVNPKKLTIVAQGAVKHKAPKIKYHHNRISISAENPNNRDFSFEIYNEKNEQLYKSRIFNYSSIQKSFGTDKLNGSQLRIYFTIDKYFFVKEIVL